MSGTARSLRYACETCRDSGRVLAWPIVFDTGTGPDAGDMDMESFVSCPACDGKSRLCGEIDEPAPEALPCNCGFSICCTCKAKASR